MAPAGGLEPLAYRLGGGRSIQLSYAGIETGQPGGAALLGPAGLPGRRGNSVFILPVFTRAVNPKSEAGRQKPAGGFTRRFFLPYPMLTALPVFHASVVA